MYHTLSENLRAQKGTYDILWTQGAYLVIERDQHFKKCSLPGQHCGTVGPATTRGAGIPFLSSSLVLAPLFLNHLPANVLWEVEESTLAPTTYEGYLDGNSF